MNASDQVRALEEKLERAERQLLEIRSVLIINCCDYPGKVHPAPNVWPSMAVTSTKSTYELVIEALEFFANK